LEAFKNLEDISFLSELYDLRNLRILNSPKLTDISVIKNLKNLEILQLSETGVTDISVLGDLSNYPNLIGIALDEDQIANQEQLKTIKEKISKRDKKDTDYYWKYDWLRKNDVR
jgi:Leucine-rich repeat (LRR) protein